MPPTMTGTTVGMREFEPLPLLTYSPPPFEEGGAVSEAVVLLPGEQSPVLSRNTQPVTSDPSTEPDWMFAKIKEIGSGLAPYIKYVIIALGLLVLLVLAGILARVAFKRQRMKKEHISLKDMDRYFTERLQQPDAMPTPPSRLVNANPAPDIDLTQEEKTLDKNVLLDYEDLKYREVYRLAQEGKGPTEIADRTGYGEGEIGLVLDLCQLTG